MGIWLVPESELTPDQLRAVQLPIDSHKVIAGPPGSGKTLVLVHRARYLLGSEGITPGRLRLFVYTRTLRDYIQSALQLLGIPDDCVLSFNAWCRSFYLQCVGNRVPWDDVNRQPDFREIRRAVFDHLVEDPIPFLYDCALVDEGHDLDELSYSVLTRISRHITVCMDKKQQIYDDGADEDRVLRVLGLRRPSIAFLGAYRCCPYVAQLGAEFLYEEERRIYLGQRRTEQMEREKPLLYVADTQERELRKLAEMIRARQEKNENIAVLFAQNRSVYGYAKALERLNPPVYVEVPRNRPGRDTTYSALDFHTNLPKVMTYYQAKGLTFDSVLMPRLVDFSFKQVSPSRLRRLLFVGITRAMKWVYLGAEEARLLPCLHGLLAGTAEFLTIRYAHDENQPPHRRPGGPTPDGEGDGDLGDVFT